MIRSASVALAALAMSVLIIAPVMAGTEPSPFQPQINQLYASENILRSIEQVVMQTMENPPIEGQPSPNLTGALNKLDATGERVTSVSGFITSIYEEVMGVEPSPFRTDIVPALEAVQMAAQDIADGIAEYGAPPDVPADFIDALDMVQTSTQTLADQVGDYVEELILDVCVRDDAYPGQEQCAAAECLWISDPTGDPELDYCCCPPTAP